MNRLRRAVLRTIILVAAAGLGAAHAATPREVTSFFRAVQMNDARTVKAMLATTINPNQINPIGGEPGLVLALREGSMDVFEVLLAHPGTGLETPAINGNTALMMAAFKANMPAVRALLAKGARVNQTGWTALHYVAAGGADDIARLLLEKRATIDAESPPASGKYTPLMMAAREGKESTVRLLLEAGADARRKNSEGLTAAQIAERADKPRIAAAITQFLAGR
jgi:ankyrin repeat protein